MKIDNGLIKHWANLFESEELKDTDEYSDFKPMDTQREMSDTNVAVENLKQAIGEFKRLDSLQQWVFLVLLLTTINTDTLKEMLNSPKYDEFFDSEKAVYRALKKLLFSVVSYNETKSSSKTNAVLNILHDEDYDSEVYESVDDRFDDEMSYHVSQFKNETGRLSEIVNKVLKLDHVEMTQLIEIIVFIIATTDIIKNLKMVTNTVDSVASGKVKGILKNIGYLAAAEKERFDKVNKGDATATRREFKSKQDPDVYESRCQ